MSAPNPHSGFAATNELEQLTQERDAARCTSAHLEEQLDMMEKRNGWSRGEVLVLLLGVGSAAFCAGFLCGAWGGL